MALIRLRAWSVLVSGGSQSCIVDSGTMQWAVKLRPRTKEMRSLCRTNG